MAGIDSVPALTRFLPKNGKKGFPGQLHMVMSVEDAIFWIVNAEPVQHSGNQIYQAGHCITDLEKSKTQSAITNNSTNIGVL